jgi:hypothetical protein
MNQPVHTKSLDRGATAPRAAVRALFLAALAGVAGPALAVPTGCSLPTVSTGVVFDKAFPTVTRGAVPSYVTASAPIIAKCTSSNGEAGAYRWTMTQRALSFTMLSGSTPSIVVVNVGRLFTAASTTLEVSEKVYSSSVQGTASVNTTGLLWNLSSNLLAGKYRLSQLFDVTEEYCKWTGNHWTCKAQGTLTQYRANYTLTVVDPAPAPTPTPTPTPTTPPSSGAEVITVPGSKTTPNPWTVRRYAAKRRCETCDALRFGD